MNRARSDAGAATLKGNIYVVGEFDGVAPTNAAEVFCPGTGRWSMISPMRVARSGVKVVAMNGLLYGTALTFFVCSLNAYFCAHPMIRA